MSTTKKPLKYLWMAEFANGHIMMQPEDDKYSKHDDKSDHNPSSFRDLLEYPSDVVWFALCDPRTGPVAGVNLKDGRMYHLNDKIDSTASMGPFKLIYYRNVERENIDGEWQDPEVVEYCLGYEYKNKDGKNEQRIITIDG